MTTRLRQHIGRRTYAKSEARKWAALWSPSLGCYFAMSGDVYRDTLAMMARTVVYSHGVLVPPRP